ncbi:hypothetical protein SKAU_G00298530 [Synaphobranchus kaupii]|uniref:Uncharacterized protein n=1 Tax=Synaphobranchus kaupii TaxID=118154 RepID=A0A9Q1EV80_SYNKA|nr:hypothetical protein SKAU_G00298530 [Synaphobranchus kaupii]
MEIKVLVLIVTFFAQVYCVLGSSANDDREYWASETWQGEPSENSLASRVADLMKRSKSQQFHALMGRRSGVPQPVRLGRKRNKGEMFVGLMGRRSSSGELQEELEKAQFY